MQVIRAALEHVSLIGPLFDEYRQFYRQPPDAAGALRFLRARLENDESVIFLALGPAAGAPGAQVIATGPGPASEALGFSQLYPSFSSTRVKRLWILNDLFVREQHRSRGVAGALMERAKSWAQETGAAGLTLESAKDNLAAQRLYEKLGWVREREFYTYHLDL